MFITNDPGPWQYYVNRQDNVGLPIMEIKNKYMQEQLLFEQQMNFIHQQQMLMSQQASGGGRPLPSPTSSGDTINDYVVDDYVEDYFI
jgi:hypothetical protein